MAKLETFIHPVKVDITGLHFSSSTLGPYLTAHHVNDVVGHLLSSGELQTIVETLLTWLTSRVRKDNSFYIAQTI